MYNLSLLLPPTGTLRQTH